MSCEKPLDPECPCGKCPEPQIPFTPPDPPECDGTECVELYDAACVKYSGDNLPCLGITTGMTLNNIVGTIAGLLCNCSLNVNTFSFSNIGRDEAIDACDDTHNTVLYSVSTILAKDSRVYENPILSDVFSGNSLWYKSGPKIYLIENGVIQQSFLCPTTCSLAYQYTADFYNCNDCNTKVETIIITNEHLLTIGNWYYDVVSSRILHITAFEGCSDTFTRSILAADGKTTCADIVCPVD